MDVAGILKRLKNSYRKAGEWGWREKSARRWSTRRSAEHSPHRPVIQNIFPFSRRLLAISLISTRKISSRIFKKNNRRKTTLTDLRPTHESDDMCSYRRHNITN